MKSMTKIDLGKASEDEKLLQDQIKTKLQETGLVFFENLQSEDRLIEIGKSLGTLDPHNGLGFIERIQNLPDMVWKGKGYSEEELHPHTDRSPTLHPPKYLLTAITTVAVSGGESTFIDSGPLKNIMKENHPELLNLLLEKDTVLFKKYNGEFGHFPVFDTLPDGSEFIRFRADSNIKFTPKILPEMKETLMKIMKDLTLTQPLGKGEGYILDNHRWLHGRKAFVGPRQLIHLMAIP